MQTNKYEASAHLEFIGNILRVTLTCDYHSEILDFAYYIYKNDEIIEQTWYKTDKVHEIQITSTPLEKYTATVFIKKSSASYEDSYTISSNAIYINECIDVDLISSAGLYETLNQNAQLNINNYLDSADIFSDISSLIENNPQKSVFKCIRSLISGSFQDVKAKLDLKKCFASSKVRYLIIDLLGCDFYGREEIYIKIYKNRNNACSNNILFFRRICDDYFSIMNNHQYTKIFLLVESPDPAKKCDESLWFSEELNASVRNIGKIKNVMIPLRDKSGNMITDKKKHTEAANVIAESVINHDSLVPNYTTTAELTGDSITGKINSDFNKTKIYYSFYLLRYGKVLEIAPGYSSENSYTFKLKKPGVYQIAGFVKRADNDNILQKMSYPVAYFPQETVAEYKNWLTNYSPKSNLFYKPLDYVPVSKPFADFVLFSNATHLPKNEWIKQFTNKYNGFQYRELKNKGKRKNSILTNGKLSKKDGITYLWSGYSVINGKLTDCGTHETIDRKTGVFTCVGISKNEIRITRDNFAFEKLFVYEDEAQIIISNRYHLLLLMIEDKSKLKLNQKHTMFKFLSMNNQLFQQNCGYQTDIEGIAVVPFYKDLIIANGDIQFEDNHIGSEFIKMNRFHYEVYFTLFNQSVSDIEKNIDSFMKFANNNNKTAVFDLTGGMDSRLIYAAMTKKNHNFSNIRINTNDVGDDLNIAITLNKGYGILFDDTEETVCINEHEFGNQLTRSFFIGMYYSHLYISNRQENPQNLTVYGAYGEFSRPYIILKFLNTQFDDIESITCANEYIMENYSPFFLTDKYNILNFQDYFSKTLTGIPIKFFPCKILLHYTLRHSYHFSEQLKSIIGENMFAPLNSSSLLLANIYSMPIFSSMKYQLDLLGYFNPNLLEIPFDDENYNRQVKNLNQYLLYPPSKLKELETDREEWEKARVEKKRKKIIKKHENAVDFSQEELNQEKREAVFNTLHSMLSRCLEIEEKMGLHLWFYANENIDNIRYMKELYNKCCSTTDELDIIENHEDK